MRNIVSQILISSRSISYFLGAGVLALTGAVIISSTRPKDLVIQMLELFGASYLIILGILVFITLFCWSKQCNTHDVQNRKVWSEAGLHAAGSVSTIALTYTLLGISLGIGTLANKELNPQTVQSIISDLTQHFSMAFMTTVIGLPIAAILQALIKITEVKKECEMPKKKFLQQEFLP